MDFTITFIKIFLIISFHISPLLLFLAFLIIIFGQIIGRIETWSISDSLYYSFITATTVGYGDFHPSNRKSKFLAILIALTGILFTGIIVAIGLKATEVAFTKNYDIEQIGNKIRSELEK